MNSSSPDRNGSARAAGLEKFTVPYVSPSTTTGTAIYAPTPSATGWAACLVVATSAAASGAVVSRATVTAHIVSPMSTTVPAS